MKRLLSQEEEEVISKNLKMARLEAASNQDNLVVASSTTTSTALGRHFAYDRVCHRLLESGNPEALGSI